MHVQFKVHASFFPTSLVKGYLPDLSSSFPDVFSAPQLSGCFLKSEQQKHQLAKCRCTNSHYHKKENTDRPGRKSAHPAWIIWFDLLVKSWRGHKKRKRKHNTPLKYQNKCVWVFVCLFAGLVCFWAQFLFEQLSSRCRYRAYPETLINS